MLLPGIRLERGTAWNAVVFDAARPTLSSAPVGGGDATARRIVNLCVSGPDARAQCDDPAATFTRLAAVHGWAGPIVGLMTGVAAARLGVSRGSRHAPTWAALATAGVGNTHRAGEPLPAGIEERDGPGTINVIAVSAHGLTAAARAEALALTAEAKTGLLAELGITVGKSDRIATGTGTDALAIACADDDDMPFTGYHTRSGQQLVAAVREAIRRSLYA